MNVMKKATLAAALAASALVSTTPAMAHPYGYDHHGGDAAALAIGAGILGLAVGAAVASGSHHHDYDQPYYNSGYYDNGWQYRAGYYYAPDGQRYDRDGYNQWQRNHADDDWRRGYGQNSYYERRGW
jgi:hypothetical protein